MNLIANFNYLPLIATANAALFAFIPASLLGQDIGRLAAASVRIVAGNSAGSGVFISADGDIVTAAHVVEGYRGVIEVRRFRGQTQISTYRATVESVDTESDLALLRANLEGESVIALDIADREPVPPANAAYCGFSGGTSRYEKITLHERTLLHYRSHDARLEPGDSGSPLVDDQTRVIGIAIGAEKKSGHSLFARLKHVRAIAVLTKSKAIAKTDTTTPAESPVNAIRRELADLNRVLARFRGIANPQPTKEQSQ